MSGLSKDLLVSAVAGGGGITDVLVLRSLYLDIFCSEKYLSIYLGRQTVLLLTISVEGVRSVRGKDRF